MMKKRLRVILMLLTALFVQFSYAQEKMVKGTVYDEDGQPLIGATVIIENTSQGTQTDFDGKYQINASSEDVLVFSYVGFQTTRVPVNQKELINVTLNLDQSSLKEVVVDSYRTTARAKSAVASSTISAESVENRPNASLVQTLTGQVPGLDISTFSGQPGANSTVELRGINSINGNTEPLFLIDGVPVNEDNFRSLNPNEIATITVLKDAGATAIYGSRGANGVVVIKTKRGGFSQDLEINYSGMTSFSSLQAFDYDFLSAQEYLRLERDFGVGRGAGQSTSLYEGTGEPFTDEQIASTPETDWLNYFFRTGITQSHNLSLSSGSENASQYTSLGYFNQEGILKDSNLQRFNFRNNISGSSQDKSFTYDTSVSLNYSKNDSPTSIGTSGVNQNPLFGAFGSLPYLTPEEYPGGPVLAQDFVLSYAPFYIIDKFATSVALEEEVKIVAGINGAYEFVDGLTARFNAGLDYQNTIALDSQHPVSRNQMRFTPESDGSQTQSTAREFSFNSTTSLNYEESLGEHSFNLGAYLEYFKAHYRYFGYSQFGLNPKTFAPGDGSGFIDDIADHDFHVPDVFANKLDAGLLSYFGAADYDYAGKYGFSGTLRRDASYRFATTNRWGTFYSVSARWNISEEDFMSDTAFNDLKIRASHGTTGNQRITGNSYWSGADLPFSFYGTGQGYGGRETIFLSQIGNTVLRWETVRQTNVGLDFGVFNNRLRGSFDYYVKKTEDLFQDRPVSAVNATFNIASNIGSLYNKGFDAELHYDLIRTNDTKLQLNFVGNYNKNELADLPSENGEIIGIGRNGGPINEIYAVRYAGINPSNGNLLFLTADGDLTENPNVDTDRVWTDKSINPDATGSFGFDFDYKGFFVTTQWNFAVGIDRFDFDYANAIDRDNIADFNLSSDILRAWTPDNRITDIPSLTATNLASDANSTRFLTEADYLNLRFASIGYTIPVGVLGKSGISRLRIYANAENYLTFSKFKGFDPLSRDGTRTYPTPKILSVGVDINI